MVFVTGHAKPGDAGTDWRALADTARQAKLTLVIYMGVATSEAIAEKLIEDGLSPDMAVAVIENATKAGMRVLRSELAGLPALVQGARVKSPALIVVGEVAAETETELCALALEVTQ